MKAMICFPSESPEKNSEDLLISLVMSGIDSEMKSLLTILFLSCGLSFYGQTCDIYEGEVINCIDSLGTKQGFWLELDTLRSIVTYDPPGSRDKKDQRIVNLDIEVKAQGAYKDGFKSGTWEYFSRNNPQSIERKVIYFEDGSRKLENLRDQYQLYISPDSLEVTGQVYHSEDTLKLDCQNRRCTVLFSNEQEITRFEYSDKAQLEYEIFRLKSGHCDREIKMRKNER